MKRLRAWLLPIFTCLTVLTVTVLPQHLSNLQDQKLMNRVHTEELTAENSLPIHPPDLVQRMMLLSGWMEPPDVMSAQHEVSDSAVYDEVYAVMLEELQSFVDAGVLPSDLLPKEIPPLTIFRMYLQQQLVGAEYYLIDAYIKTENIHLWMVLDGETRDLLWLELGHPAMEKYYQSLSPAEIGTFFLDRLGVENDLTTSGQFDAVFQISGTECQYAVSLDQVYLRLFPWMAYPATDADATDSYSVAE